MNKLWNKTFKTLLIIFFLIVILSLIGNILYYYNLFSNLTMKYFEILSVIIIMLIGGFIIGYNAPSKAYLYGLRLSLIIVLIMILFGFIFNDIHLSNIVYYVIITVSLTFGSMLGIMKKTKS